MKINPDDIIFYGQVASVTGKRKARQSRALDDRSYTFTFKHVPTETVIKIDTGLVHWSRAQVKRELENLRTSPETIKLFEDAIKEKNRIEKLIKEKSRNY